MFDQLEIKFLGIEHFTKDLKVYNFLFNGVEYGVTSSDIYSRYSNGWALLDGNGKAIDKSLNNLELLLFLVYCVNKIEKV